MANKKVEEFENWYKDRLVHHEAARQFFCELISGIPKVEMVRGRVKSYEECLAKFRRKYLPMIEPQEIDNGIQEYITDIIGIRAVCFYSDEVYEIRRNLKKFFKETDISDKTGQLEKTDDKFGYKSLHLQLLLKNGLKEVPGADIFKGVTIELQVRTVIQDAWSILDHKIKYKKSIPQHLKRRINRLSALFEIADDEFLSIQKGIIQEELKINKRLKKGGKIETAQALDVFRFLFVALKHFPEYNFVEEEVDSFVQEILEMKDDFTEGELFEALDKNLIKVQQLEKLTMLSFSPYMAIKFCLHLSQVGDFEKILSADQLEIIQLLETGLRP
ncbi:GTP pyrophosphokinase [Echinicola pacifica]|uniref:GTP pyrophosphokinase n=1 Tax=Echinicola pacifica TaxID=346377 RepID=UPI0012F85601|nr:(p)ppGpp synthetase [Echinicola pacifica]